MQQRSSGCVNPPGKTLISVFVEHQPVFIQFLLQRPVRIQKNGSAFLKKDCFPVGKFCKTLIRFCAAFDQIIAGIVYRGNAEE